MRTTVLLACLASVALLVGCYNPRVGNGGFACSPSDNPPCPNGFHCVNGLCLDSSSTVPAAPDLALPTGTGGNGGAGGGGGGGAASTDMAHAASDLAFTPADLSGTGGSGGGGGGSCAKQGSPCNSNSDCCGMVCFPGPGLCVL